MAMHIVFEVWEVGVGEYPAPPGDYIISDGEKIPLLFAYSVRL